jgi:formiminotetrahydrofolate cyclodeaminase
VEALLLLLSAPLASPGVMVANLTSTKKGYEKHWKK